MAAPSSQQEDVWRRETPHVLTALLQKYGDMDGCEDAVQEALVAASEQWPVEGIPDQPRGWLIRVADRRMVDQLRRASARSNREEAVSRASPSDKLVTPAIDEEAPADDTLLLLLLCAHPDLSVSSQVALTLRAVAGLTTAQIAAAFLVPESTMSQRISRAKTTISGAEPRFPSPEESRLGDRLAAVHHVLYVVFTEGHTASSGDTLLDGSLAEEAIRLTRRLHQARPRDDELTGLLALMLLTHARRHARTNSSGDLVPLQHQDRLLWDDEAIGEGVAMVESALPVGQVGPYQLQAAIAACHSEAKTWADTDWEQITILYRMLERIAPGPAVSLNLAVAVGMSAGPVSGLEVVELLLDNTQMVRHHRTHAVRAHLLEMAGRTGEARAAYLEAARLTRSVPEQRYLNSRAAGL
ncbi:MAG: sigma-70 family RNA polymerase sigma factor [Acidimicrobiia bacterium]|nr:sigma-70 family RNA polymerase sigma factor [Acidimicrobiia bacterium]